MKNDIMTAKEFNLHIIRKPKQYNLERHNKEGYKAGHLYYGLCDKCNCTRFICGHEIKVSQENTNE